MTAAPVRRDRELLSPNTSQPRIAASGMLTSRAATTYATGACVIARSTPR